jgi:hypothetical protein
MSLNLRIVVVAEIPDAIDADARRQNAASRSLCFVRDGIVGIAPSGWLIENRYSGPIGPYGNSNRDASKRDMPVSLESICPSRLLGT